jgi:hypothetical protein
MVFTAALGSLAGWTMVAGFISVAAVDSGVAGPASAGAVPFAITGMDTIVIMATVSLVSFI